MNPFNIDMSHFSPQSSVWIYIGDKKLSNDEAKTMMNDASDYCLNWKNHGKAVQAESIMLENQALIFVVGKAMGKVGGCSIDGSVRFVKEQGQHYNTDFLNRMLCAYISGDKLEVVDVSEINNLFQQKKLDKDSLVLNTSITNRKELEEDLVVKLDQSWYWRFVQKS